MKLSRTGLLYVAVMAAAGLVIGIVLLNRPGLRESVVPPVAWPIGVSLVLDLALLPAVASGRMPPVSANERVVAFLGAGLIILAFLLAGG